MQGIWRVNGAGFGDMTSKYCTNYFIIRPVEKTEIFADGQVEQ